MHVCVVLSSQFYLGRVRVVVAIMFCKHCGITVFPMTLLVLEVLYAHLNVYITSFCVGFRNDFVTVELQSSDGDIMCSVLVTCVQFSNSYEVEVNPGMKRASLNCAGGTESNVVIVLNDFDPSIVYKYRVTTESIGDVVEVTVQGTFTAGKL